jgi:hypothetical protein
MPAPLLAVLARVAASIGPRLAKYATTAKKIGSFGKKAVTVGGEAAKAAVKPRPWRGIQAAFAQRAELKAPTAPMSVAEEIKGLTLRQRAARLTSAKAMLTREQTAERMGGRATPQNIMPSDVVEESEKAQQSARTQQFQAEIQSYKEAQEARSKELAQVTKTESAFRLLTIAAVKLPAVFVALSLASEKLVTAFVERRRELAKYDMRVANAFARLDRQELQLKMGRARATGGSAAFATTELAKLRQDIEPVRRMLMTYGNLLIGNLARIVGLLSNGLKYHPIVGPLMKIAELIEKQDRAKVSVPLAGFIDEVLKGQIGPEVFGSKREQKRRGGE